MDYELLVTPEELSCVATWRQERILKIIAMLREVEQDDGFGAMIQSKKWDELNKKFSALVKEGTAALEEYCHEMSFYALSIASSHFPALYGPPPCSDTIQELPFAEL